MNLVKLSKGICKILLRCIVALSILLFLLPFGAGEMFASGFYEQFLSTKKKHYSREVVGVADYGFIPAKVLHGRRVEAFMELLKALRQETDSEKKTEITQIILEKLKNDKLLPLDALEVLQELLWDAPQGLKAPIFQELLQLLKNEDLPFYDRMEVLALMLCDPFNNLANVQQQASTFLWQELQKHQHSFYERGAILSRVIQGAARVYQKKANEIFHNLIRDKRYCIYDRSILLVDFLQDAPLEYQQKALDVLIEMTSDIKESVYLRGRILANSLSRIPIDYHSQFEKYLFSILEDPNQRVESSVLLASHVLKFNEAPQKKRACRFLVNVAEDHDRSNFDRRLAFTCLVRYAPQDFRQKTQHRILQKIKAGKAPYDSPSSNVHTLRIMLLFGRQTLTPKYAERIVELLQAYANGKKLPFVVRLNAANSLLENGVLLSQSLREELKIG